ncbi:MAG: hypothetical protein ACI81G_000801, partial [Gammaproteobacteria bacterium]
MKKITFLLLLLITCVSFGQTFPEPGDWPGTGSGPVLALVNGVNTVTGTVTTPGDGQDRFQVLVPTGASLTASNFSISTTGGPSGNTTFNSSVVIPFPSGAVTGTPYGAGTYSVLVAADFAVGNSWTMTFTMSAPVCTAPTVPTVTATSPICPGTSTNLNITGTLNDATQWAVYSGSCGGTLVGTTTTSTFSVTPPTGTTTYFVRGEGGCVTPGSCGSVVVTAQDTMPPVITCPGTQTENADTSCVFALPDYTGLATAVDNCNASPAVTQSPAPGTMVGLGDTTVTLTANDGNGQTANC